MDTDISNILRLIIILASIWILWGRKISAIVALTFVVLAIIGFRIGI